MKVAVTGAGGLLGSALVRRLMDLGNEVIALSTSLERSDKYKIIRWNANLDVSHVSNVLKGVDVIIHSGAYIPRDHNDPEEACKCFNVNASGTLNLLHACELASVQRFIYISGSNTLKPRSNHVREDDPIGCEHSPYYLGSKVLGEIYVRSKIARGMDGLIVRPSSIYGPGMKGGVIANFAERIRMGMPIILHDDGSFQADYIWRDDVVNVLCQAVAGKQTGEVNLGSGQAISVSNIANHLVSIFNVDSSLVKYLPSGDRCQKLGFSAVDISRAREWFNFDPVLVNDGLVKLFGGR